MSYKVVPCHRHYFSFLQQALRKAHYLPSHYQIVPILFCDLTPYHLNIKTLIVDSNGDVWFSNQPSESLSQNILQDQHLFIPFNTCLGSLLWLNLRYCSYFNTLEDQTSRHTVIKYGFFYYQLNTHRNLSFIYPLSIRYQSLSFDINRCNNSPYSFNHSADLSL
ncbi:hypothetical protein [Facklamia sp. 7083-14-GEN3]|uniref:hypothetical protein n=1 Tax=Facklamia sp. 7083-14-GEN3 TaxID=2973478 RepID=UPI00215BF654|nr:hypothetical protein [Facklamia sp. 7083-14-GEN3]MCR8969582.1 hypothetical protein [Facklamia sp. 7083-14-GEN3]